MENKYYTPSIKEFHVGFEFEFSDYVSSPKEPSEWHKGNFGSNTAHIFDQESWEYHLEDQINKGHIRVKYLDKEDVESLGFKYEKHYTFKKYIDNKYNKTKTLIRIEYDWNNHSNVLIEFYNQNNFTNGMSFIIKNKSELRILLKQLGIDE